MDTGKFVGLLVFGIVGILVVMAFVPMITETTSANVTLENKGFFNAVKLDENSEHTLSFDYTKPSILTVDGTDIDMSALDTTYSSATVIFSNDWFMRYGLNTGVILYKCGTSSSQAIKGATASNEISVLVTISNGTATFEYSDDASYEYSIGGAGLIITPEKGDYVMKIASDTAYVNADSEVYGVGRTDRALGTSGTSFNAMVKASITDGVTALYYSPQYTWGDAETVNYTANNIGTDLYNLTGFTFNLVDNDEEEHAVTYNQIFVPVEVTSEKTYHASSTLATVINLLPLIAVIGLFLILVGEFLYTRYL